jgi:iron complex outermembrane recepter protein
LSLDWALANKFFFQSSIYTQHIRDYIFLKPLPEPQLTIRGAFPVFEYNQTDAQLAGADYLLSYAPFAKTKLIAKYAYVMGNDLLAENTPLIFIPPGNLDFKIEQSLGGMGKLKENNMSIAYLFVQEQKRFSILQDFAPPPKAFSLVGISLGTSVYISKSNSVKINLIVDNLFNANYRNYLNRQRYFADEIGRNISIIARYKF